MTNTSGCTDLVINIRLCIFIRRLSFIPRFDGLFGILRDGDVERVHASRIDASPTPIQTVERRARAHLSRSIAENILSFPAPESCAALECSSPPSIAQRSWSGTSRVLRYPRVRIAVTSPRVLVAEHAFLSFLHGHVRAPPVHRCRILLDSCRLGHLR